MHRIPVLPFFFSSLRLFLHGYDDYDYEFECRMSIFSHYIHVLLDSNEPRTISIVHDIFEQK